jgi:hypothetical protein
LPNIELIKGVENFEVHHEFDGANVLGFIKEATLTTRAPRIILTDTRNYCRDPDLQKSPSDSLVEQQRLRLIDLNEPVFLTDSIENVIVMFIAIPSRSDKAFCKIPEAIIVTKQYKKHGAIGLHLRCPVGICSYDIQRQRQWQWQ